MNANPPIEYVPDEAVGPDLDAQLRALLSTCFTGPHNERFKTQRFFATWKQEWMVEPVKYAMVKPLAGEPWPEGEIDLRGPMF